MGWESSYNFVSNADNEEDRKVIIDFMNENNFADEDIWSVEDYFESNPLK